jgi:deazaflavin-dependent oxidoreductase (nitroreductase family)
MGSRDELIDLGFKILNRVHRLVLHASGNRIGTRAFGMSAVELRSVGRRTGLVRSTMLTVPVEFDGSFVLVASKGGDDRDPDWYRNVMANPTVQIVKSGRTITMQARVASGEERERLWPQVIAAYRPYAGYRRRAHREIPLVICEPR